MYRRSDADLDLQPPAKRPRIVQPLMTDCNTESETDQPQEIPCSGDQPQEIQRPRDQLQEIPCSMDQPQEIQRKAEDTESETDRPQETQELADPSDTDLPQETKAQCQVFRLRAWMVRCSDAAPQYQILVNGKPPKVFLEHDDKMLRLKVNPFRVIPSRRHTFNNRKSRTFERLDGPIVLWLHSPHAQPIKMTLEPFNNRCQPDEKKTQAIFYTGQTGFIHLLGAVPGSSDFNNRCREDVLFESSCECNVCVNRGRDAYAHLYRIKQYPSVYWRDYRVTLDSIPDVKVEFHVGPRMCLVRDEKE